MKNSLALHFPFPLKKHISVLSLHMFDLLILVVKKNSRLPSFACDTGQTVYTCMLNHKGLTEADLTVSVIEPGSGAPHAPKFEG